MVRIQQTMRYLSEVFIDTSSLRIKAYVTSTLVTLTWAIALVASAQGLVGASVDPIYGQSSEVGMMADFGYDNALDLVRIGTSVFFLIAFFVPLSKAKRGNLRIIVLELIGLAFVPVFVWLVGQLWLLNNFRGLGCPL